MKIDGFIASDILTNRHGRQKGRKDVFGRGINKLNMGDLL